MSSDVRDGPGHCERDKVRGQINVCIDPPALLFLALGFHPMANPDRSAIISRCYLVERSRVRKEDILIARRRRVPDGQVVVAAEPDAVCFILKPPESVRGVTCGGLVIRYNVRSANTDSIKSA